MKFLSLAWATIVTAVRGIYSELQLYKRGKVFKIGKDNSNALVIYYNLVKTIASYSSFNTSIAFCNCVSSSSGNSNCALASSDNSTSISGSIPIS